MKISVSKGINLRGKLSTFVKMNDGEVCPSIVYSFSKSYYNKSARVWELPLEAFKIIVSNYLGSIEIIGKLPKQYEQLLSMLDKYDKEDLAYEFKTTPFNHQLEAFNYGKIHNKFLLADEQGLGKTKQALDMAMSHSSKFSHCLIVCGVNGLKYNWLSEISTHTTSEGYILGTRINKQGKEYIGGVNERLVDLQNLHLINKFFIITNVETLRNKEIQTAVKQLTNCGTIGMTIIDEVHRVKNSTSSQGKAIHCCNSYYKIALTGTPMMNNAIDLYNILKWLEVENHTLGQFKSYYCYMGGYGGYQIVGYKHMDELQKLLDSIMLRRKKEDVLDLPEKLHIDEYLEMGTAQQEVYKEVHEEFINNIDKIILSHNPLVELTRLRQATSYTGILSTKVVESIKLTRMVDIVQENALRGGKCVVFSSWTSVINPAYKLLVEAGMNPAIATGEIKDTQAEQTKFKTQDSCKVILGTVAVLGTGFTLTEADTVIFLDDPWNRATKDQAEDRCHRIGTKNTVNVYTLICKYTIDERIHKLMADKGELSDVLVDKTKDIEDNVRFLLS